MTTSPKVLIVDDDLDLLDAVAELLELEGFHAIRTSAAEDALQKLRGGLSPDVILLDLMMPGMNGWGFRAAQLADPTLSRIPVVVMTANYVADTAMLQAHRVLRKPTPVTLLVGTLQSALDSEPQPRVA